jgi:hypothetical protein
MNEELIIGIKQEEIPEDITFPDIKSEPDEVSYVCICLLLDTFYHCLLMSVALVVSVFLGALNSSTDGNENVLLRLYFYSGGRGGGVVGLGVGGRVCTGWDGLQVTAEQVKIYSYLHWLKILIYKSLL